MSAASWGLAVAALATAGCRLSSSASQAEALPKCQGEVSFVSGRVYFKDDGGFVECDCEPNCGLVGDFPPHAPTKR